MWFLLLWALGLVSAGIHFFITGIPTSLDGICKIVLLHQFAVTFGLVGIIGLIVNIIYADKIAKQLNWPGGPFQIKYGFSQIGLGLLGIMAIWFQGNFWVAVLVTMYIYGISGFWTHTQEMIKHNKVDPGHVANLIMDVLYQSFITVLSILAGGIWVMT